MIESVAPKDAPNGAYRRELIDLRTTMEQL
jgi:hypothetical protein